MSLRFAFTLGLAGAVGLAATLTAQSADTERIHVRVQDRVVTRSVDARAFRTIIEQSSDDPCRDRYSNRDDFQFCEVREETMPAGPLTVDAGTNGGIRVEGWDRSEIHVQAVINTRARTEAEAKQLASGVQIQAGGGKVMSTGPARTGDRESWSVSFRINVPRHNDLDLNANNGGVTITGVTGTIHFETSNGGVRLTDLGGDVRGATHNGGLNVLLGGARWEGAGLDVETTNGGVTLEIPDGYNADLTTRTVNGSFRTDLPITVQGELTSRTGLQTTLGSGGPPVNVRTTNGGLKINRR
jgi:hypothetical protein